MGQISLEGYVKVDYRLLDTKLIEHGLLFRLLGDIEGFQNKR